MANFYETDEDAGKIRAAFQDGEKGFTSRYAHDNYGGYWTFDPYSGELEYRIGTRPRVKWYRRLFPPFPRKLL